MLVARAKHIFENYIMTRESIDINGIKEITKKKDKTKIINNFNKINIIYNIGNNLKLYTYNNIYIIYDLTKDIFYIYDKEKKSLIKIYPFCYSLIKFFYSTNNNIIVKYNIKNQLAIIYIFRCGFLIYSYDYFGKIKNDKYKANYRLLYFCFVGQYN
jgi:hypothetical protein